MENNIYSSPKTDTAVNSSEPGSVTMAVIVSSLIDIIGSLISGVILIILHGAYLASSEASEKDIENALSNLDPYSAVGIIGLTMGAFISMYAGYICAKISNRKSYKATRITAAIGVGFVLLVGLSAYSTRENIVFSALTIASIFVGSWFFQRKFQKA